MDASITIVSGLPRSGTSMLMQMLQAGGMPLLVDDVRAADTHNPKGYFEYEAVKRLKSDAGFLPFAQGKAVKIVSHFLEYLPREHAYNVLFVRRSLVEIMASQNAMLHDSERANDEEMKLLFEKHLNHVEHLMAERECFRMLELEYVQILNQPRRVAEKINLFLDQKLDIDAMAQIVDTSLHRNRE